MAILVTGGTGYIGSHTTVELIQAGFEVVIVDDLSNSKLPVLERIETITGIKPRFYEGSVLNRDLLRLIFRENFIEAVIHFAAFKAVGESVEKPLAYYHNNIGGLITVLEVMNEFGCKSIVFSSSATVYGMNHPSPLEEDMTTSATNPYGQTKLMNEQILIDLGKADPTWRVGILRYFNPIGAHESGLIGEDPQGIPNNLMPYITQVAIGKREKLNVFGNDYDTPDGTGVRDYIHVVDLALGHLKMLEHLYNQAGVEIVNLGTGIGYSVLDLVHTFEKVNKVKIPYEIVDRREGDVAKNFANVIKAKEVLHWETQFNLEDMCRDSWNWQSKNPKGIM